jgi:hypothetical protein
MRALPRLALLVSSLLLPAGALQAQTSYTLASILRLGEPAGDVTVQTPYSYFDLGTLNDRGQIVFAVGDTDVSEALIQYSNGQFTPIAARGRSAPGGRWTQNLRLMPTVRMNQQGDAVFSAGTYVGNTPLFTSYLWQLPARSITPLVQSGTPASADWLFEGTSRITVINNSGEIALTAKLRNASGTRTGEGIFLRETSGDLVPIALPGQTLPGGGVIAEAHSPDLNDAGLVAFLVQRQGDPDGAWSAYLWANGIVSPLVTAGAAAPGGPMASVWSVWLNSANRDILMELAVPGAHGGVGLYRYVGGRIARLAVPGQDLPGGGILQSENGPSYANAQGQHAFLAALRDGSTAAYLIGADNQISLVLKSGTSTELGRLTNVGQGSGVRKDGETVAADGIEGGTSFGVGLNNMGQLALTVGIEGEADTLALLTPRGP